MDLFGITIFIGITLLIFYLPQLRRTDEFDVDELPFTSLIGGTILNALLILFIINKGLALQAKLILVVCWGFFGSFLMIGRYYILRKRIS
jgi:hypothetical protein